MPNLEDVFLELCLQDGDMETSKGREEREKRPAIINCTKSNKDQTKASSKVGDPLLSEKGNAPKVKQYLLLFQSCASFGALHFVLYNDLSTQTGSNVEMDRDILIQAFL